MANHRTPLDTSFESKLKPESARFAHNQKLLAELVTQVRNEEEVIHLGGGAKAIESQHKKGRLTARERVALLIDAGSEFFELGSFVAWKMYEEWGGAPSGGVVTGLARVHGRLVMLIVNDATVKAGAFFPMTAKKVIRAQNIAIENHIPTIYLVDSAGVFLPLQEDVFPDTDDFGRVFRNNAVMSAMGIPQIAAIMGMCVAGGAYLPLMCDHHPDDRRQRAVSGRTGAGAGGDWREVFGRGTGRREDALARSAARWIFASRTTSTASIAFACSWKRWATGSSASSTASRPRIRCIPPKRCYGIFDGDGARQYDMNEIIARIVDNSQFSEYKAEYGETVLCGYARIGGFAVGIVANQKTHVQQVDHAGNKRMEFGGVIYTESAEKAARFIMDCNQNLVPLVFLHDVNGFMVGRDAEWSGIIRAGAKMVNAVSNSVVPKIAVIIGGSFGAGHYAMCGKAYDPRFVFAWPTAKYAVMGGAAAANTLVEIKIKQLERGGTKLSEEDRKKLYDEVKATYDEQMDPRYGAARLWIDKIIDPVETREAIVTALEAASLNPDVPKFSVGVLQT